MHLHVFVKKLCHRNVRRRHSDYYYRYGLKLPLLNKYPVFSFYWGPDSFKANPSLLSREYSVFRKQHISYLLFNVSLNKGIEAFTSNYIKNPVSIVELSSSLGISGTGILSDPMLTGGDSFSLYK